MDIGLGNFASFFIRDILSNFTSLPSEVYLVTILRARLTGKFTNLGARDNLISLQSFSLPLKRFQKVPRKIPLTRFSSSTMDTLSKGIFYCYWMSDKPLVVQQSLVSELAEIVLTIPSSSSPIAFLRGFWHCLGREWGGIDRLRRDTYQMLVRRFVYATFALLARTNWDDDTCKQVNGIYIEYSGPLCPTDPKVPSGLTHHLCDIYLDELKKVIQRFYLEEEDEDENVPPTKKSKSKKDSSTTTSSTPPQQLSKPTTPPPLLLLIHPLFNLISQTPNPTTMKTIQAEILTPLFTALEENPNSRKRSRNSYLNTLISTSPDDVRLMLLSQFMSIAGQDETGDSNRRMMHSWFKKIGGMGAETEAQGSSRRVSDIDSD